MTTRTKKKPAVQISRRTDRKTDYIEATKNPDRTCGWDFRLNGLGAFVTQGRLSQKLHSMELDQHHFDVVDRNGDLIAKWEQSGRIQSVRWIGETAPRKYVLVNDIEHGGYLVGVFQKSESHDWWAPKREKQFRRYDEMFLWVSSAMLRGDEIDNQAQNWG